METSPSPALSKLAEAIRRHRKRAGLTQLQLAELIPCSDKTISAIEVTRERPSRGLVGAIERALKVSENALLDLYDLMEGESLPGWMRDWVAEERRTSRLRSFELAIIPGLLQTEEYARALLNDNETAVLARMERQAILLGDEPPTLHVVLDEGVLHRNVGGREVMYKQLRHLIECASETLTIQVAPSDENPCRSGAFTIGTLDGSEVAYIETAVRGIVTSSQNDIAKLNGVWENLRSHTLSQRESLALIERTAEDRWT